MTGIKVISDGLAIIQNGNASFNTINVETITSSNLTDCNLLNCTTNDPTSSLSIVNKQYVDNNYVDNTSDEQISGVKTFNSIPLCSLNASINNELVNFITLNSLGFTTLALVQSNPNVWINTNIFNSFYINYFDFLGHVDIIFSLK